ncbi:MAG: hypothetical protein ABI145_13540 [Steroidobacteraceae bacterium]
MSALMAATDLDAFLYASIGQDKNGVPLSMLSVFARRDTDPWEEAAKLSRLSKANAVSELSAMLDAGAGVPDSLAPDGQALLAARLVALLPLRDASPLALRVPLISTLLNKHNAGIIYFFAILLVYLIMWCNT